MLKGTELRPLSRIAEVLAAVILLCLLARPALADSLGPSALTPGDYDFSLTHGGRVRTYLLHIPPQAADKKPLAVVLNFHGGGGAAKGQKEWSGLDAVADREGFLAVYPDGTGRFGRRLLTWNAGTCCGYARTNAVDDVGFVSALLVDLAARTPVDRTRVYATGMSNGAMMSYRLAVEASERIAAIAPVAGGMVVESFTPHLPMPVMHFHSVDDPRALYQGGLGPRWPFLTQVLHPPVEETIGRWVQYDACPPQPEIEPTRHGTAGREDARPTPPTKSSMARAAKELKWCCGSSPAPGMCGRDRGPNIPSGCSGHRRASLMLQRRCGSFSDDSRVPTLRC